MSKFLVTAEGGLTTAGYALCIVAAIVLFLLAISFAGKASKSNKFTTKQLVFCAMGLALAYVTSYIKLLTLPWGGSICRWHLTSNTD